MNFGRGKKEQRAPYVQTRYKVDLWDGEITDPDNRGISGITYISMYDYHFTTRNVILAKAVSEDIRGEKVRSLQQSILDTQEKLKALTK